jgi:hypothetical protein
MSQGDKRESFLRFEQLKEAGEKGAEYYVGVNERRKSGGTSYVSVSDLYGLINSAVEEALARHTINCPIPADAKAEIGHLIGVVKDMGGGNVGKGAEEVRSNAKFVRMLRERSHSAADKILMIVLSLIVTGGAFATWVGIKHYLGGK